MLIFKAIDLFTHWLKPVLPEAEYGTLRCEYIIRKDMINPMELLHGGVTAGIIDDIIWARCSVIKMGKQIINPQAHLFDLMAC